MLLQRYHRRDHQELPRQEETCPLPGIYLPHLHSLQVVEKHMATTVGVRMFEVTLTVIVIYHHKVRLLDYMYYSNKNNHNQME